MDETNASPPPNRLRQERLLRGWSQQELADQLGTTMVTISRWERGIQYPGPKMRLRLSMLFEKTERELGLRPEAPISAPSLPDNQTMDQAPLNAETQEQGAERAASVAHSSSLTYPRPYFLYFRSRWMVAASGILLVILVTSLFLGLHLTPTTSTARSRTNTTPTAGASWTVPAAYGVRGQLVLDDALQNEQTGKKWLLSDPNQPRGCHFLNNAYDIHDVTSNYCLANNTDYTNFVYQIQMTFIRAQAQQAGRILFRADDSQDEYYDFQAGIDGYYYIARNDPSNNTVLMQGYSSAIIEKTGQPNILAVKAIGKDFYLYVNFHLVAHMHDAAYTHGNIGIGVSVNTDGKDIEVAFRNARVWNVE